MRIVWSRLKNYFLAGLIAVLPLWISYYILVAVFKIVASGAKPFLKTFGPLQASPSLLTAFSFGATLVIILLLGVLLTNVLGRRIFLLIEKFLQKLPVLSMDTAVKSRAFSMAMAAWLAKMPKAS